MEMYMLYPQAELEIWGLGSMSFIEGNSILYSSSNQWIQIVITYNVDLSDIF